jgi:pSer/pThr/pTyr-binding forkhead associated (FHA) protein
MNAIVTLTVTGGSEFDGREFVFNGHTMCAVGRSSDCLLNIPDRWLYRNVSRHHCLLDIDPPMVWARDLDSRNGTFVNGEKIGQRDWQPNPAVPPGRELHDGDTLRIGDVVFQVGVNAVPEAVAEPLAVCVA